jgi:protein phosphatase PTC7
MAHSMPTFLVGSDEQRELLDQFQRRCLHFSEAYQKNKPLCFSARAFQKSHPEKEEEGIDDADATLASPMLLGICDGVSQVNDLGLDAAELPKELLKSCEEIASSQLLADPGDETAQETYSGPIALLKEAYAETESLGSTSVLLAVMDNSSQIHGKLHPMIGVVTLGDCELVVLRRKKGRQGPLEVVLHTEMQRIGGQAQTPLQLCRMNTHYDPGFEEDDALDAIERGSGLHCTSAYEGDMVIMGSDGVFDNLFLNEVVAICNEKLKPLKKEGTFVPAHPAVLSEIAQSIVEKANGKSQDEDTPVGRGGKADDTSVVVAEVVEWTQTRREVWERSRRRQHWSSIFNLSSFNCRMTPCTSTACMDGSATSDSDSDDEVSEPTIKCSLL